MEAHEFLPQTSVTMAKNRYLDVLPCAPCPARTPSSAPALPGLRARAPAVTVARTAVRLPPVGTDAHSGYINANLVGGAHALDPKYIATQAPTERTVPDFWRMVWHYRVSVIAMITRHSEGVQVRRLCCVCLPAGALTLAAVLARARARVRVSGARSARARRELGAGR